MAGKTSTSFGLGVLLTILGLTTVGFMVAFAVFYAKYTTAKQDLAQYKTDTQKIVGQGEANQDTVRVLINEAGKQQKSLVRYLVENREATMQRVTGDKRDNLAGIDTKLGKIDGADQPLVSFITSREIAMEGLKTQLAQAEAARDQALHTLSVEIGRIKALDDAHKASVAQLNGEIAQYKDEIEQYRSGADDYKKATSAQLDRARSDWSENEKRMQDQVTRLTEQKLILEAQVAKLRNDRSNQLFRGQDEAALVDGQVIGTNEVDKSVIINLGRKQKMILGMSFSVYSSAEAIKLDDAGVYEPGKATLEVINVGETSSTCRVTSEMRGNPVIRGDVVANAVYDPAKVYKFVVFGSFDADRDGVSTPVEREEIESMVRGWGGDIVPDLSGDVDFIVLGERPTLPPRPADTAPLALQLDYKQRVTEVERYDQLFRAGGSTGVPILNENRLYTLIGKTPAPTRRGLRTSR
jgi:hypothetical protein